MRRLRRTKEIIREKLKWKLESRIQSGQVKKENIPTDWNHLLNLIHDLGSPVCNKMDEISWDEYVNSAVEKCGEVGCEELVWDHQDDLGPWCSYNSEGFYVAKCKSHAAPPSGDR